MIVDDSEVMVQLLVHAIDGDNQLQVAGVGRNGEEAVLMATALKPDIITMDLVMPRLDGLGAIRRIMANTPLPIVVLAALTSPEAGFEAVRAGALAVVEKPQNVREASGQEAITKLLRTLKLMADVKVITHRVPLGDGSVRTGRAVAPSTSKRLSPAVGLAIKTPRLIAVAASTGGPPALLRVLGALTDTFPVPIVVVQHIAEGFGVGLVKWLDSVLKQRVVLARYGDVPAPGAVYVAPDTQHLLIGSNGRIVLSSAPPVHAHRPSANLLFESVGQAHGAHAVGIMLTGMGADGAEGMAMLKRVGGICIAQDEATCVVFGMPRAAIEARAVDRVLSLDDISLFLQEIGRVAAVCQDGPG